MKILTIGIDGGDERILRAMPMPNLHKILDQNVSLQIEEDLWSRGWVKILCGTDSKETGAFYERPLLEHSRTTTQRFSTSDYSSNPDVIPLWERLSEKGYRVGFMNVPSMFPAPKVNGFIVSGGGAGSSASGASGVTAEGCYPIEIKELLETSNYILDTRLLASGIRDVGVFVDQLIKMTGKRTLAFQTICNQQNPDMGFIAYMALCRIQYLAMSEIENLISNNLTPQNFCQEKILSLYEFFDKQINDLVLSLEPNHIMLVSDHGQGPIKFKINLNDWLKENSFQSSLSQSRKVAKGSVKRLAKLLPSGVKKIIKNSAPRSTSFANEPNANWKKTEAFSMRFIPGIYINDRTRFDGIIKTDEEMSVLIEKIITAFNQDSVNKQYGLRAIPYREKFQGVKYEAMLPDIWIEHEDVYKFEMIGKYIVPNENYGPITSIEGVESDVYTGCKGRYPLLSVSSFLAEKVESHDERDLTLAYKLIVRAMEPKNNQAK